jgi:tetratricopeptide (TPR) repeat protein
MADRELFSACNAAVWKLIIGNLEEVEEQLPELHRLKETAQVTGMVEWLLRGVDALLQAFRGKFAAAADQFKTLQHETRSAGDVQMLSYVDNWLGEILYELGDLNSAEEALCEAIELGDRGVVFGGVWPRHTLSKVYAQSGSLEKIAQLLAEAKQIEIAWGSRMFDTVSRMGIETELAFSEKRWSEACVIFDKLITMFEKIGSRWYKARALQRKAIILLSRGATGDREAARNALNEALTEFKEMGSEGYMKIVQDQLASLGTLP